MESMQTYCACCHLTLISSYPARLSELRLVNNNLQELPDPLKELLKQGVLLVQGNEALLNGSFSLISLFGGRVRLSDRHLVHGSGAIMPILGNNRSMHKKESSQDIRAFLSAAGYRSSVNVSVNPLAMESPLPRQVHSLIEILLVRHLIGLQLSAHIWSSQPIGALPQVDRTQKRRKSGRKIEKIRRDRERRRIDQVEANEAACKKALENCVKG